MYCRWLLRQLYVLILGSEDTQVLRLRGWEGVDEKGGGWAGGDRRHAGAYTQTPPGRPGAFGEEQ